MTDRKKNTFKIVCDDAIPFLRGVFEPLAEVVYMRGSDIGRADVEDASALIVRTRTRCDRSLLEGSSVRLVASATIGVDHIDTEWCREAGIRVVNAPGCNSSSVAQWVLAVLCGLAEKHSLNPETLTLGIVGAGSVGSKVAYMASALGMKTLLCDPPRQQSESGDFVSLDTLVEKSDIVSLHVPLNAETRHLFDEGRLSSMRPGQFLINSSRGAVVDNAALLKVLENHGIAGAALDVWEGEPDICRKLLALADYATPHIAGYSADGKAAGTSAVVNAVVETFSLPCGSLSCAPLPETAGDFVLDAASRTTLDVLSEALSHCYDINRDSSELKDNPCDFELLRETYPTRREPPAYRVFLMHGFPSIEERLRRLGFRIGK